ncbi:MAG: hypothetical protein QOE70_1964 [Chthoniobacter sp.]|nr:hypothetical protein [Chthoniobacter sp.]
MDLEGAVETGEQPGPLAEAAADVGERCGFVQPPARGPQVQKIALPPIVALLAEVFGGMGLIGYNAGCG